MYPGKAALLRFRRNARQEKDVVSERRESRTRANEEDGKERERTAKDEGTRGMGRELADLAGLVELAGLAALAALAMPAWLAALAGLAGLAGQRTVRPVPKVRRNS